MTDDDVMGVAALAASDQLGRIGEAMALEFAGFYRTLIDGGIPATLAKQMTVAHQAFRYGWEGDE